ncbi:hypothetical protein BU23DRAFT_475005 [Bimuria novae-zelandiae CBS 107.79]|uniref:Secreted protein n=1 Tax=Bimuria novae-zelandiae CBS 107.79 TaxID=1447943 RepID=A0A6A5UY93_9PLEO|nr:hypothetical protein BU23DRAFT_475005 [Bimuria novae-zelandiae CBS 107.79]
MIKLICLLSVTASALLARADYGGIGQIHVWNSSDWRDATPVDNVGCLGDSGKFVNSVKDADCGVFSRSAEYPYALSPKSGNCTFNDETQERNTDSIYGGSDYAYNCLKSFQSDVYDDLYTIDGFPYTFLCNGDVNCYYDAKKIPTEGQKTNLWPYRWGSQQMGITPGHVMLQLVWNKTGDL